MTFKNIKAYLCICVPELNSDITNELVLESHSMNSRDRLYYCTLCKLLGSWSATDSKMTHFSVRCSIANKSATSATQEYLKYCLPTCPITPVCIAKRMES